MDDLTGEPVSVRPERTLWTGRSLVVRSFLVRAADDAVGDGDRFDVVLLDKPRNRLADLRIVADINALGNPSLQGQRLLALFGDDANGDLAGVTIIGTIESDGRRRVSPEASFCLLLETFGKVTRAYKSTRYTPTPPSQKNSDRRL